MQARALALFATAALPAAPALAHHSFAKFNTEATIEIEGEVAQVAWRNPHVLMTLSVPDETGEPVDWEIETSSPGMLARMDVTAEAVRVGDVVRAAGNPAADGGPEMFATNLLLSSGEEVLLRPRGAPRWAANDAIGDQASWFRQEGDASAPDAGVFRVWSSTFAGPALLFPDAFTPGFTRPSYPLTEEARGVVEAFDAVAASAAADCTPKGMPQIMEQPYNMAFEEAGEDILLRIEEYDVVRVIHMASAPGGDATAVSSPLGFSTGRWEDGVLIVETTRIDWPWFKFGVPQSPAVHVAERFIPTAAGDRLDYEIVVTDPATFTEPVALSKYWISIPGQDVALYGCTEE